MTFDNKIELVWVRIKESEILAIQPSRKLIFFMFNVLKSGRYFSSLCMQSRGVILIQMKCHLPCFLTGILQISGIILHPKCTPTSVFQHSACVADLFPIQTHVNFQPVLFNSVCTSLCFEEALKNPDFSLQM